MYANTVERMRNHCWNRKATMHSMYLVVPHVTVNNAKLLSFVQQCLWWIYVASNNDTYLSLHVLRPMFLSDFKQIWIFLTDLHIKSPISNFTEIRLVGTALTSGQTDTTKLRSAFRDYAIAPSYKVSKRSFRLGVTFITAGLDMCWISFVGQ
jgi:hypothetical protein